MTPINHLQDIMAKLRDPKDGCPWDLEQTFASIAPHTIEEAYEVADAIDRNDKEDLKNELGDLLLQVIFHAQLAKEEGSFSFDDVANAIITKLIVRHPHIFSDASIKDAQEQEASWEAIKQSEREQKAKADGKIPTILDGVASTLPGMVRAIKLQKRAARVGFDFETIADAFDKTTEELGELSVAINDNQPDDIKEEYADLLFSVANLGRKLSIHPEEALKQANAKFISRFSYVEQQLYKKGSSPSEVTLAVMEALWNEAKKNL